MSSEAGKAEEKPAATSPLNHAADKEDDPISALYSQQARIEQGSPSTGDSAADRAKQFLAKKREETVECIRTILADRISTYDAIKNQNIRSMAVPNLIGGLNCNIPPVGDFLSSADGRLVRTSLLSDFGAKTNSSLSFNSTTMTCISCSTKHQMVGGKRMAFLLADQAFSPCLPAIADKQCLFILRIENGSISDLVDKFLLLTRAWKLPPGTALVVSSATELARCGTAAYAASLASNGGRIHRAFHGDAEWIPGPPLLLSGTSSTELIRSLLEISLWIRFALPEPACTLADSFGVLMDMIKANAVGPLKRAKERRFMMPCSLSHLPDLKTWASANLDQPLPTEVRAFNEEVEAAIITSVLAELNSKLGFDLDPQPNFSRQLDPSTAAQPNMRGGFLIIGSSHATRTTTALREEGNFVNNIKLTNWKAKNDAVLALTDHVKEAIRVGRTSATIFQLYDSLLYLGMLPDGTTAHPMRDRSGKYHVVGDLVVAGKEAQHNIYKTMRPALLAASGGPIIIITPMPRYITHGCCEDESHLTNRASSEFSADILRHLAETRTNFRSFAFNDNVRNISVINPALLFDSIQTSEGWDGSDPIHPMPSIYRELAKLINRNMAYLQGKNSNTSREDDRGDGGSSAKRGRDSQGNYITGRGGWGGSRGGYRRGNNPGAGGSGGGHRYPRYY